MITATHLRERLAQTALPVDPLDVEMPEGSQRWPQGMREHLLASLRLAGVLIPVIHRDQSELSLLLTQRAAELKHHAGQVSFPGGRMEPGDADIAQTALRETFEEVGIHQTQIDVIGYLNPMPTITGYAVTPVVGLVDAGYELTVDRTEVEEVFEVPLAFLLDPANQQFVEREFYGGCAEMIEFHYDSHRIWGATAFIIEKFIKLIKKQ